jgi:hypothetical protein
MLNDCEGEKYNSERATESRGKVRAWCQRAVGSSPWSCRLNKETGFLLVGLAGAFTVKRKGVSAE